MSQFVLSASEADCATCASRRNCAFVNFTNIANAIKAIDGVKTKPDYTNLRIAHGKDRCANPPRSGPQGGSGGRRGGGGGGSAADSLLPPEDPQYRANFFDLEPDEDLDLSEAHNQVWLVKVPKFLYEGWGKVAKGGVHHSTTVTVAENG